MLAPHVLLGAKQSLALTQVPRESANNGSGHLDIVYIIYKFAAFREPLARLSGVASPPNAGAPWASPTPQPFDAIYVATFDLAGSQKECRRAGACSICSYPSSASSGDPID